jgi:Tfp pilus assembly pilus retraction ATPase PilT
MKSTDLHIKIKDPKKSLVFPGPRVIEDVDLEMAKAIIEKAEGIPRDDFMVDVDGVFWRGRRDRHAVDGMWLRMRRMADTAPSLDTLPSPLPGAIKAVLLSRHLSRGGLVHVTGGPGCGKTTTGCGIVVSRLNEYGGAAFTVEEPPELPLNGFHGKGYCTQTWVAGDLAADWIESMRGALRSQPAGTNLMLYVGEVRDPETASAMLRAASNGFLVVSTGFGSDIVSGVDTFFQLLGHKYALSLAGVLRVVLHQTIRDDRFTAQVLVSESPSSPVAALIRKAELAQLQNEVQYQHNRLVAKQDLWAPAA